jgi:hypothetical protein
MLFIMLFCTHDFLTLRIYIWQTNVHVHVQKNVYVHVDEQQNIKAQD